MHNLTLRTFEDHDEPDSYPFPRAYAAGEPSVAVLENEFTEAPVDSLDLAARIEESLEQLQLRLDRVRNDLEAVYRFPDPSDWPPRAA